MSAPARTFNSFTSAKRHVITLLAAEPLTAPVTDAFDVDSIAACVVGPMTSGYPIIVGVTDFWEIAERHRR